MWKVTKLVVNGKNETWSGAKYMQINGDTVIYITAVEAEKESGSLTIDNAAAIDFYINDQLVEGLVDGENTLECPILSEGAKMIITTQAE